MTSLPPDYFEELYSADIDPWAFRTSVYEKAKYAATLAALPKQGYASALEIGCSIGELTVLLAQRAGHLTAVDTSMVALHAAKKRCTGCHNVSFVQAHVPRGSWAGHYDLIVLSEVLYYLDPVDLARLAEQLLSACSPGTDIIMVHWTGTTDYPLTGDEATSQFLQHVPCSTVKAEKTAHYRLDVVRVNT